jgi:chromosome segregation ATPase
MNPNHDPKNGRFASGKGVRAGGVSPGKKAQIREITKRDNTQDAIDSLRGLHAKATTSEMKARIEKNISDLESIRTRKANINNRIAEIDSNRVAYKKRLAELKSKLR